MTILRIKIDTRNKAKNPRYCGLGCQYLYRHAPTGLHICVLFWGEFSGWPTRETALQETKRGGFVRCDQCIAAEEPACRAAGRGR